MITEETPRLANAIKTIQALLGDDWIDRLLTGAAYNQLAHGCEDPAMKAYLNNLDLGFSVSGLRGEDFEVLRSHGYDDTCQERIRGEGRRQEGTVAYLDKGEFLALAGEDWEDRKQLRWAHRFVTPMPTPMDVGIVWYQWEPGSGTEYFCMNGGEEKRKLTLSEFDAMVCWTWPTTLLFCLDHMPEDERSAHLEKVASALASCPA